MKLLVVALAALALVGCGRSSLYGEGPGSGGLDDLGSGGCSDVCLNTGCDQPNCCACQACQSAPFCMLFTGGDMRGETHDGGMDMGPDCGDSKNCMLPACVGDPRCHTPGTEICNNGIDDNNNGLIDCADPQCFNFPGCQKGHMCDPNHVDCTDPQCVDQPQCQDLQCHPSVDFGTLNPMFSSVTRNENTKGTKDVAITQCAPGGGGMVVGEFRLSAPATVTLTWSQGKGEDHVFALTNAGINQACGDTPITCIDAKGKTTGSSTFPTLPKGHYYLITQAFEPAGQGPITVTLSTPTAHEICNNGIDDNNNGLIDCADPECFGAPNCVNQECHPDFNLGALVVNGPSQTVSFDTRQADVENNLTCQAQAGGDDVVIRFTLQEPAGILLKFDQTGDHVIGFLRTPPGGQQCDASPIDCFDPNKAGGEEVAWTEQPAGDYEIIFKATRPGLEGHVDATLSAYRNRKVELCHNGIDDDNNGFIDCADPACKGVAGCSGPYCQPDQQLGNLSVGQSASVSLNLANGIAGYNVSCAKGGGKGEVVQLTVPSGGSNGGFQLGFDCQQPSGDAVLDLFAAGGPRDTCDAGQQMVCADPSTLPFGCGYVVPNLQPGTYNVIVQSFTGGTEGQVELTLTVFDDRLLEICNNGIDDDHDGYTDCADRKCITSPYCAHAQCKPDAQIIPMPLTGAKVSKLVQTSGAPVSASAPCASAPGGSTAVVALQLTAKANLTLGWNQIGNHDFALYTDAGAMLPCNAGTVKQCSPSHGAATGSAQFNNVPSGLYYLLVAADAPDTQTSTSSGSVALQLSGTPAP
jgi:hypothetical protein